MSKFRVFYKLPDMIGEVYPEQKTIVEAENISKAKAKFYLENNDFICPIILDVEEIK